MFATVIVPLDGSTHAEAALPYAVDEARHHDAKLHLVRVVVRPEIAVTGVRHCGPAPQPAQWPAQEIERETAEATSYLFTVKDRYRLHPSTTMSVLVGDPVPRLRAEIRRHPRPLIVLTTGDATTGARTPLSEVARRLLVIGAFPILAVRFAPATDQDRVVRAVSPRQEFAAPPLQEPTTNTCVSVLSAPLPSTHQASVN